MRLLLTLLAALLVLGLVVGAGLTWAGGGDFVDTLEETALGADVTAAQRARAAATTGLEVPATATWHAYRFHSSLDPSLDALFTLPTADAESLLARPPLGDALWRDAPGVPTLDAALADWPAWPTTGATVPGRAATVDLAPGRTLAVTVGEPAPGTRTLRLSWQTY